MQTMAATIVMVVGALIESLLKTVMTMMAMVPVLKKDRDDDNESVNVYGVDGGCVVDFDEDADALHRGEGGDDSCEYLGDRKSG